MPYPSPLWIHPGPPCQGLGSGAPYGRCSEEQVARISVPASTGGTKPKYILGIFFVGRAVSMFILDASRSPVSRPRKRCSVWTLLGRAGRPDIRPCSTGGTKPKCILGIFLRARPWIPRQLLCPTFSSPCTATTRLVRLGPPLNEVRTGSDSHSSRFVLVLDLVVWRSRCLWAGLFNDFPRVTVAGW